MWQVPSDACSATSETPQNENTLNNAEQTIWQLRANANNNKTDQQTTWQLQANANNLKKHSANHPAITLVGQNNVTNDVLVIF